MMIETGAPVRVGTSEDGSGVFRHVAKYIGTGRLGPVFHLSPVPMGDQFPRVVKVLMPAFTSSAAKQGLCRDGSAAVGIRDRNVLPHRFFHDGLKQDNQPPYVVMDHAEGGTLAAFIEQASRLGKPLPPAPLYDVMCQLLSGMEAINRHGVHRDLKPANILKVGDAWKIADHGLSALAREATRQRIFRGGGSFPCLAPEVWDDKPDAVTMDIYALGMVFYQLATLQPPFGLRSQDPLAWSEAHHHEPILPPDQINPAVPPRLSQTIRRMVEKDPRSRLPDWSAVRALLSEGGGDPLLNKALNDAWAKRAAWEDPEDIVVRAQRAQAQERTAALQAWQVQAASPEGQAQQAANLAAAQERTRLREEEERAKAQARLQAQRAEADPFLKQIDHAIIQPLEKWSHEPRRWGARITTESWQEGARLVYTMKDIDGTSRRVDFTVLLEGDFQVLVNPQDPRERFYVTEFPTMQKLPIRAIGLATLEDGRGCNLVLLDKGNGWTGDWLVQINSLNLLAPQLEARPGPFPISVDEIAHNRVTVTTRDGIELQKYRTEIRELDYPWFRQFFFEGGARDWEKNAPRPAGG